METVTDNVIVMKGQDASLSWEGYEYQGDIALNYAIKNISNIIKKNNWKEEIKKYKIQVEGEEDFAIIKDDNYISLHQVKKGKENYLDIDDKFCFVIGILQRNNAKGYLHFSKNRRINKGYFEITKEIIPKKIKEIDCKAKKGEITLEKIKNTTEKDSIFQMLNSVMESTNNQNVPNAVKILKEELNSYLKIVKDGNDDEYYEIYEDVFEESSDAIDNSKKLMKDIIIVDHSEYMMFFNDSCAETIYSNLKKLLKDKLEDHNRKKSPFVLEYEDIYNKIVTDYHEKMASDGRVYYDLWRVIKKTIINFKKTNTKTCIKEDCTECKIHDQCNLFSQINMIKKETNENKNKIMKNLMVYKPKTNTVNYSLDYNIIKHFLLEFLFKIKTMRLNKNEVFSCDYNNLTYRLSLINNFSLDDFLVDINEELGITDNPSFIFENDVIITNNLSYDKVNCYNGKFTVVSNEELDEVCKALGKEFIDFSNSIIDAKEFRLVKNEEAIEELG